MSEMSEFDTTLALTFVISTGFDGTLSLIFAPAPYVDMTLTVLDRARQDVEGFDIT